MPSTKPGREGRSRGTDSRDEKAAWEKYFDYLVKSLRDPDSSARVRAAQMLGDHREVRAVEALHAALFDPDTSVRQHAAAALGKIGAPAVEPLIAALNDPDTQVRQLAAKALGQIGEARVIEPLVATLRDPEPDVYNQAAFALKKIGAPAVEPLIAALHDSNPTLRWNAARILGQIGDARALPELERVAREDKGTVKGTGSLLTVANAARQAVEKIKPHKR